MSRGGKPGITAGQYGDEVTAPRAVDWRRGKAVTGAAGLRLGLPRGGATAGLARRQVRRPGSGPHGEPAATTRELKARERLAATSTRATRPADRTGRSSKMRQLSGCELLEVARNPSRALRVPTVWPTATLDRTRPPPGFAPLWMGKSGRVRFALSLHGLIIRIISLKP
jgi:hypothetical protein